jgi:predicted O-linked N-acetylglucosamine transferase (SPINDLY family)
MRSNYLYFLNYLPEIDDKALLAEHRRVAAEFGAGATSPSFEDHDRSLGRPLRIGYVSPDLRRHALSSFLEPILANDERGRALAICYADVGFPDETTARLRSLAHGWREIRLLSDDQVVDQIHRDRIDILVDLAGHTARNRLGVFGRKPAPVQVTYLGYPGTTGLLTFDALLTDEVANSPGGPAWSTEAPLCLPGGLCCYAPPRGVPEVVPPPLLRAGFPTFGSLHKLPKLNSGVLDLWSMLLKGVPVARLLMPRDSLKGRAKDELLAHFAAQGVPHERIDIRHEWGPEGHWGLYASIDLSLDVFPWCGHTTACESLWMGVPIVTLAGERRSSRLTASVLTMMGLDELIAESPQQYIEAARRLIGDPGRLAELRPWLRERMLASRLCDGPSFTRDLELAYAVLWRQWCRLSPPRA